MNKSMNLHMFGKQEDYIIDKMDAASKEYKNVDVQGSKELVFMAQMVRIADALEEINDTLGLIQLSLEKLEEITECISKGPGGDRLCITGTVSTYEGY